MEEEKSKSQKKRDAHEVQKLGVKLVNLDQSQLETLELSDELKQAILAAKSLKSHGAKRRQAQYIGKLMRDADYEAISTALETIQAFKNAQTAQFHQVENWRTRLISEGRDALTEFIECYKPENIQHLRQLIKKAQLEQSTQKNTGAGKALFRYLRSYLS